MSGTQLDPGLNLNRSATREYQRNGSIRFISHTQNRTEPVFSARFRFGSSEPVLMPRPSCACISNEASGVFNYS